MIIKEITYNNGPHQFCVFQDQLTLTPLVCFLSAEDCEKWINENVE